MSVQSSLAAVLGSIVFTIGCTGSSPVSPTSSGTATSPAVTSTGAVQAPGIPAQGAAAHGPEYSPAYYNGATVTMNEIEIAQNDGPLVHAAADLYAVIYPANHALWPATPPQCNPCDHNGNGTDTPDFHDHVLDSIPGDPGHGEFNPLWRLLVIRPADPSPATQSAYAARLPMTSEAAVDAAIAAGVAVEVDTGRYFICSVVSENAAR